MNQSNKKKSSKHIPIRLPLINSAFRKPPAVSEGENDMEEGPEKNFDVLYKEMDENNKILHEFEKETLRQKLEQQYYNYYMEALGEKEKEITELQSRLQKEENAYRGVNKQFVDLQAAFNKLKKEYDDLQVIDEDSIKQHKSIFDNKNKELTERLNNATIKITEMEIALEESDRKLTVEEKKNKILNEEVAELKQSNDKKDTEIKALTGKIELYTKDYNSTSFFERAGNPILNYFEVNRQTKKNKELTKNIDMNTELYKSIFGKFDSYKKSISAWIDNNFKSYCNYINTIADVSEYNKDVIEDLLNLINDMENWIINIIFDYEKKLKTKKTKTAIKTDVEDEIADKKIGKKTKARKIPEKPELIDPPLPDNLTDAEKLLNAPRESEKRAEPSN